MRNCTDSVLCWIKGQRPIILYFIVFALSFCNVATAQNLTYTNNWLGNSGGLNSLFVQEEIHNMWISSDGTSYTATWWDESKHFIGVYNSNGAILPRLNTTDDAPWGSEIGGNSTAVFAANGATSLLRFLRSNGSQSAPVTVPGTAIMGIVANDTEVFVSSLNGRIYVYNATTLAAVRNFNVSGSGRLALDGAGFLWAITGNTTLKRYSNTGVLQSQSITLPAGNIAAAVTVNTANNTLYVIDRGADQNIKVYNNVTTAPVRTSDFGVVGGILSGTRPGLVGSQRFSFNRINDTGVYGTGIPGQIFGTCGIGVDNSGNIYVLHGINSGAHIEKYNASGSMQWRLIGHTFEEGAYIDPTTDETDVYAGGHHYKMNYGASANTEMASWYGWGATVNEANAYNAVERGVSFAGMSPIRIANIAGSKFIYMMGQTGQVYVYRMPANSETLVNCGITDDSPSWTRGSFQDVDATGAIWSGDNLGFIEKYPCTGVSGGIPTYNLSSPTIYPFPAPYAAAGDYARVKYISETDVMYILGRTTGTTNFSKLSRYNNWSTTRTLVYTVDMYFTTTNMNVQSFDIAGDYIFADYFGAGATSTTAPGFGLVKVWNANTGAFVMDMNSPANYNAGDSDNRTNTRAFKRSNGEYIITFLDHVENKTVVFRWTPGVGSVPVSSVSVNPTIASLAIGATQQLTATVLPTNATNQNVTWSSSNTAIATVNSSGLVTAVSAGSANITVTSAADVTKTATSVITVTSSGGSCNTALISDNFDAGFGNWVDGGTDAALINNAAFAYSGTFSAQIRDNTATSVISTNNLNLSTYSSVEVSFTYTTISMDAGEDFWLQLSNDGGATYSTVKTYTSGTDFNNGTRYFQTVTLNSAFTSTSRLRFRNDASNDDDEVYIDNVVVKGCTDGSTKIENTDAGWTWSGYTLDPCTTCSGGSAHSSTTVGHYGQYTFTGNKLEAYCETYNGAGSIEVFIDNVSKGIFSQNITPYGGATLFATISNFSQGSHIVKFVQSNAIWAGIDYIKVFSTTAPGGRIANGNSTTEILVKELSESKISVYPNPVKDGLSLHISGIEDHILNLNIVDVTGRSFFANQIEVDKSKSEYTINPQLSQGIYILILKGQKTNERVRIVVN